MSFLAWIVVGLIAGWLAKVIMPGREPGGFLMTMLIGIVGAVFGGWIWRATGMGVGATGVNIGSIFIATIGALVFLAIWKAIAGKTASY
ncbi:MAG: GlsB/YeaQ/YmgE family stress response membrane protein [Armatimonadetes bacterium]|nr:GlsB/YeaQ/YmgE family stress response membrane protein [Armatimonadota bacterium]